MRNALNLIKSHWSLYLLLWTHFVNFTSFGFQRSQIASIDGSSTSRRFHSYTVLLNEVEISTRNSNFEDLTEILNSRVLLLPSKDANVIITKVFNILSKPGFWTVSKDILQLLLHDSNNFDPDVFTLSAAMSLCIRHKRYDEALKVYEIIKSRNISLDAVAYSCAIRAAGSLQQSLRHVIEILDDAFLHIGNRSLSVAHTAMTNCKYERMDNKNSTTNAFQKCQNIFDWITSKGIAPSEKTMDILLSVACVHGSRSDWKQVLRRRQELNISLSIFTFNTLLNQFANKGDVHSTKQLLHEMQVVHSIRPDAVTYNTLLKLYVQVDDAAEVVKTLATMKSLDFAFSDTTMSLVIRFLSSKQDGSSSDTAAAATPFIVQYLATSSSSLATSTTPSPTMPSSCYTFANAIAASQCVRTALKLIQQASRWQMADEAVFVAAANVCTENQEYDKAIRIIDTMIARALPLNTFALTLIIKTCFQQHQHMTSSNQVSRVEVDRVENTTSNSSFHTLERFLRLFEESAPTLLHSQSICDSIVRNFLLAGRVDMALKCHIRYFRTIRCKPQTLNHLFNELQSEVGRHLSFYAENRMSASSKNVDMMPLEQLSKLALSIIDMYAEEDSSLTSSSPCSMLRTNHFNIVLKLLNIVGNFSDIIHLFDRMTSADELLEHRYNFEDDVDDDQVVTMISGDDGSGQFPSKAKVLTSKKTVVGPYKPGTFTIAEFIRSARRYNSSILAVKAMTWGIENSVYIPLAVISDCIFLLYSEGRVNSAVQLYRRLYERKYIQHWMADSSEEMILDLHRYNRGMASAAIKVAIQEIRTGGLQSQHTSLVIITGKSLPRLQAAELNSGSSSVHSSYRSDFSSNFDIGSSSGGSSTFVLSDEIQRVLIEDFLPPIPSSTVPGNPGRLHIDLAYIL